MTEATALQPTCLASCAVLSLVPNAIGAGQSSPSSQTAIGKNSRDVQRTPESCWLTSVSSNACHIITETHRGVVPRPTRCGACTSVPVSPFQVNARYLHGASIEPRISQCRPDSVAI